MQTQHQKISGEIKDARVKDEMSRSKIILFF